MPTPISRIKGLPIKFFHRSETNSKNTVKGLTIQFSNSVKTNYNDQGNNNTIFPQELNPIPSIKGLTIKFSTRPKLIPSIKGLTIKYSTQPKLIPRIKGLTIKFFHQSKINSKAQGITKYSFSTSTETNSKYRGINNTMFYNFLLKRKPIPKIKSFSPERNQFQVSRRKET